MNNNVDELENLILEKNHVLNNIGYNVSPEDRKKIQQTKQELDKLLYKFYKGYIYKNTLQ